MTEDQDINDSQSDVLNKSSASKLKDKKTKPQRPLTKIIIRRLPPTMTEAAFLEQVSPIPEHDYFYFAKPDFSLGNNVYSRAYINFVNVEDIYLFRDKYDGYVFLDEKGLEYVSIVEYSPFQRIPKKKKKKDPKCGTIESDPIYQEFIESLKDQETESQPKLEFSYPINDANDKKVQSTPLLEYLAARKMDKRGRDERRRRENDKRKMRIERKAKDLAIKEEDMGENDVKKVKSRDWDKDNVEIKDDGNDPKDIIESKIFRERKSNYIDKKKKNDTDRKENTDDMDDSEKSYKKEKRDKFKESPREQKSKKYSDTRKERLKQCDSGKSDKQAIISKLMASEAKKSLNHDDIKPFTQWPQVKTEDYVTVAKDMEKKIKIDDNDNGKDDNNDKKTKAQIALRRYSYESSEGSNNEETYVKRQQSLEDRSKSTDREGSEEKEKSESIDRRTERRIRNKDRPSLVIYQPGMGKFSKQRLAKDKDVQPSSAKSVSDSEKKDT